MRGFPMIRSRVAKFGFTLAMSGAGLCVVLGSSAPLAGCGETSSCQRLRTDTYNDKLVWGECDPNDSASCIEVFGNVKDCTGVLSCNFAVNRTYRETAERAVLTIGAQSQGCYVCATPNCVAGDLPYCEPVTRQCLLITELLEGGVAESVQAEGGAEVFDASVPLLDASAVDSSLAGD
jgi:hypothetical protein